MASLDFESLFTNTPLEETIKNCVKDLFSNNFYSGKLSRKDLYDLLKLATTESSFFFDNKLYKQIDGAPIGSFLNVKITCKSKRFVISIFAKPRLVEFLLITIVLFLIPIR